MIYGAVHGNWREELKEKGSFGWDVFRVTVYLRGGGPVQPSTMEILEVGKK